MEVKTSMSSLIEMKQVNNTQGSSIMIILLQRYSIS
uniref:Uncharacterized protein n=1 Tax=Arundo donax TaxID=35708 RepID=A0A0A9GEV0_ARUDO